MQYSITRDVDGLVYRSESTFNPVVEFVRLSGYHVEIDPILVTPRLISR